MGINPQGQPVPLTLQFDKFWGWLQAHCNCILRAGTPDAVLFDHDDFHWHLANEDEFTHILQLVRGKELVGEVVVLSSEIAYVQCNPPEQDESVFECIVETPSGREAAYHFVMAHEFDGEEQASGRRWTH
jgi:hypothetical protein